MSYDYHTIHPNLQEIGNVYIDEFNVIYKTTLTFINNTNSKVTVVDRNNVPNIIAASQHPFEYNNTGHFTIRKSYYFNSNSSIFNAINMIADYKAKHRTINKDIEIIYNVLWDSYSADNTIKSRTVSIDRSVSIDEIKEYDILYIPDVDLIIKYGDFNPSIIHPFSQHGITLGISKNGVQEDISLGFSIDLVDNENNIKNRYMYLINEVVEIPIIKDNNRPSGAYVSFRHNKREKNNALHYKLEDLESKLNIYKTIDEAKSFGNPEVISKTEYIKTQSELETLKQLHEKEKLDFRKQEHQLKIKENEREIELNKLEAELKRMEKKNKILKERLEASSMKRKDRYEDNHLRRKNDSEIVRWIPTIIGGVLTIMAGIFTIFKKV